MSRFYAAEPTPTITGSNADHRIAVAARDILPLAQAIATRAGLTELDGLKPSSSSDGKIHHPWQDWIEAVVRALKANRNANVIISDETQPLQVHDAAATISTKLSNKGVASAQVPPHASPP